MFTRKKQAEIPQPHGGERVLVVDDDVALGRQIVTYLHKTGIGALHEDSGESAIEAVRNSNVDVAVVDIDMPGVDGIETAQRISAERPGIRVVLMSGYAEHVRRANGTAIDVFAVVDKPLPLHTLARFVQMALAQPRTKVRH